MQKVLTAAEMREVDRLTTERYGIPSIILMENAAHAVARVITEKLGGSVKGKSILILCGKGNNGGDGAALARLLWQAGADSYVVLFGKVSETRGDARVNFQITHSLSKQQAQASLNLSEVYFGQCDDSTELRNFFSSYLPSRGPDVFVDALFGTGMRGTLDEDSTEIISEFIGLKLMTGDGVNLMISVDMPSGVLADSSEMPLNAVEIRPDTTVTFTAAKPANVLPSASQFKGELIIADIGSPQELIDEQPSQLYVAEKTDAVEWLRQAEFSKDSYKNKRGHALLIAGSESYSGAAVLAANAAMRSGVGLVTLVTPRSSKASVESRVVPEVMVRGAAESDGGAIAEEAYDELGDLTAKADVVAIGSGMSQGESTAAFVRRAVAECRQPLILDADALNVLAPLGGNWPLADAAGPPKGGTPNVILTPHEGEFLRLLGSDDRDAIKDRVSAVREFSQRHNVILVLKGERVLIGEPGGKVVVNPTGNSGLGKAGNGDTLAGILAGFVAQAAKMNIDIFETVVAAVYIAGMAGDIAEKKFGKRVMTASDVRECLTEVFAELEKG